MESGSSKGGFSFMNHKASFTYPRKEKGNFLTAQAQPQTVTPPMDWTFALNDRSQFPPLFLDLPMVHHNLHC